MLSQQMQWHSAIPTLVLLPLLFTWTMLTVVAVNVISLTAHTALLQTAPIARLLEWNVKVSLYALTAKSRSYWVPKNCIIIFADVFKHSWKCNTMVYNFMANKTLTWHLLLHKASEICLVRAGVEPAIDLETIHQWIVHFIFFKSCMASWCLQWLDKHLAFSLRGNQTWYMILVVGFNLVVRTAKPLQFGNEKKEVLKSEFLCVNQSLWPDHMTSGSQSTSSCHSTPWCPCHCGMSHLHSTLLQPWVHDPLPVFTPKADQTECNKQIYNYHYKTASVTGNTKTNWYFTHVEVLLFLFRVAY